MRKLVVAAATVAALGSLPAGAAEASSAPKACAALAHHVDEAGGAEPGSPVFLRSYEPGPNETRLPGPLASSAFSYDNALAIIALASCGDFARARRIGDAFVIAVGNDRTYRDGRVRNAYRAGPLKPGSVALPGWWDAKDKLWAEDAYQDGTQTGNVAWVALALLTLDRHAKGEAKTEYRNAAEELAGWIATNAAAPGNLYGFSGGVAGFDGKQSRLTWRSTEHNVDVHALGIWLSLLGSAQGQELARPSRLFLDAMFDAASGHFRLGTMPDGTMQPPGKVALDALTWPLLGVPDAPSEWRRSLDYAQAHLATDGGFDFAGFRQGLWTEGTAQASVVTSAVGQAGQSRDLLATALRQQAPSGYLYATDVGTISTGLRVGPDSVDDDFFYFHRPHLGATAWAVIAASGINPFTGARIN